jgi:hypothetical protein
MMCDQRRGYLMLATISLLSALLCVVPGCRITYAPIQTPASVALEPAPTIILAPAGPSLQVLAGEVLPISTKVTGVETEVTWTATCLQDQRCQVLKSPKGSDNFMTAPNTLGEQVTVRATVEDKYGRQESAILIFRIEARITPTAAPAPSTQTPTPSVTSVPPTWTPTPTPLTWAYWVTMTDGTILPDGEKSTIETREVPGKIGIDIQVSFKVIENVGWVRIQTPIDPKELAGTEGVRFYYKGNGAANTIETKLVLGYPDLPPRDTYFLVSRHRATDTGNQWKLAAMSYDDFTCGWDDCLTHGNAFDLTVVKAIDLAISNKPGDVHGSGTFLIDDLRWMQTPQTLSSTLLDKTPWQTSHDDHGSTIDINSVKGKTDNAVQVGYNVKSDGSVVMSRNVEPSQLLGTEGIRVYYKGSGAPNTLEFRLILRYPGDPSDTTFGVSRNRATNTGDKWKLLTASYDDFRCWFGQNCEKHKDAPDPMAVKAIVIAVSNNPGAEDVEGPGIVIIDGLQGM